jgi:hypothetical protein
MIRPELVSIPCGSSPPQPARRTSGPASTHTCVQLRRARALWPLHLNDPLAEVLVLHQPAALGRMLQPVPQLALQKVGQQGMERRAEQERRVDQSLVYYTYVCWGCSELAN